MSQCGFTVEIRQVVTTDSSVVGEELIDYKKNVLLRDIHLFALNLLCNYLNSYTISIIKVKLYIFLQCFFNRPPSGAITVFGSVCVCVCLSVYLSPRYLKND